MTTEKYDAQAAGWTDAAYADPERYLRHRADLVVARRPLARARRRRCSTSPAATRGSRRRCSRTACATRASTSPRRWSQRRASGSATGSTVVEADLNDYAPPAAVACTTCFRALYYARDRAAFFRHVAVFTEKKLVFDLNPRQFPLEDVVAELAGGGSGSGVGSTRSSRRSGSGSPARSRPASRRSSEPARSPARSSASASPISCGASPR